MKTDENRLADEIMPDIQFGDLGQRRNGLGSGKIEAVAGMAFEAEVGGERRRGLEAGEFMRRALALAMGQRIAPGAGVQFDDGRADRIGRLHGAKGPAR